MREITSPSKRATRSSAATQIPCDNRIARHLVILLAENAGARALEDKDGPLMYEKPEIRGHHLESPSTAPTSGNAAQELDD
jgi:hypothetical protein